VRSKSQRGEEEEGREGPEVNDEAEGAGRRTDSPLLDPPVAAVGGGLHLGGERAGGRRRRRGGRGLGIGSLGEGNRWGGYD
jgi:hypothetical protein